MRPYVVHYCLTRLILSEIAFQRDFGVQVPLHPADLLLNIKKLRSLGLLQKLELNDLLFQWTAILLGLWLLRGRSHELVKKGQRLWLLEFELLIAKFDYYATAWLISFFCRLLSRLNGYVKLLTLAL